MVSFRAAIEIWCEDTWGQTPHEISEWFADADQAQVFIKLNRGVLLVDFSISDMGDLDCSEHLHIPLDRWNPGSIQAHRTNEGRVRFRHRQAEILFSAHLRAPEYGKALLEEWLMAQRGESTRPKDASQRIASIKRSKMAIERNLRSASFDAAKTELALAQMKLNSAESNLDTSSKSKSDA